jgi:hypothetical protein
MARLYEPRHFSKYCLKKELLCSSFGRPSGPAGWVQRPAGCNLQHTRQPGRASLMMTPMIKPSHTQACKPELAKHFSICSQSMGVSHPNCTSESVPLLTDNVSLPMTLDSKLRGYPFS